MSKQVELKVTLTFSDEVPKAEIANITENVIEALSLHVEHSEGGLTGDEFDAYTTEIEVESNELTQHWNVKTGKIETV